MHGHGRPSLSGKVPRPRRPRVFLLRLKPYFRHVAGLLVVGSIAGLAMNVTIVLPAVFLGRAINTVLAYQHHHASSREVGTAALLFVAGTAATHVPRIGKRYWLGLARTRLQANVRSDALRGVLRWPMDQLAAMSVGGVMARVIGDVEVLGLGVGEVIVETWDTLLFSVSLIVTMFLYSPRLALFALAPVPAALLLAKAAGRMVAARTSRSRQADADLTTVLHEQLGGHRLLRLTGRASVARDRVRALASAQASAELDAIRLDEGLSALYLGLLGAGVFFIVWLGGGEVARGALSVGGLVAFLQLFARFITRAPRIPQMANRVQAAGAAFRRLEPLLAAPIPASSEPRWSSFRSVHVAGGAAPITCESVGPRSAVHLSLRRVTFSYPGALHPALRDLDLEVRAGSFVAVTGAVGSGKSALARLAAGVYSPEAGEVLVGDTSLEEVSPAERVRLVGYLGQDAFLFTGSVAENLLLSPGGVSSKGMDGPLRQAVSLAALDPDLALMPEGLATEIGELGVRISGGQRQRIGLARALGARSTVPGLIVLDDPFSAVDVHTEATIARGLRSAFGPKAPPGERASILLLSHRLAAFPMADHVVVLEAGRVEEQGSHSELMASGGLYSRIYRAQARLAEVPSSKTVDSRGPS